MIIQMDSFGKCDYSRIINTTESTSIDGRSKGMPDLFPKIR